MSTSIEQSKLFQSLLDDMPASLQPFVQPGVVEEIRHTLSHEGYPSNADFYRDITRMLMANSPTRTTAMQELLAFHQLPSSPPTLVRQNGVLSSASASSVEEEMFARQQDRKRPLGLYCDHGCEHGLQKGHPNLTPTDTIFHFGRVWTKPNFHADECVVCLDMIDHPQLFVRANQSGKSAVMYHLLCFTALPVEKRTGLIQLDCGSLDGYICDKLDSLDW